MKKNLTNFTLVLLSVCPLLLYATTTTYMIKKKCLKKDAFPINYSVEKNFLYGTDGNSLYGIKGNASKGTAKITMWYGDNIDSRSYYHGFIYGAESSTNSGNDFEQQYWNQPFTYDYYFPFHFYFTTETELGISSTLYRDRLMKNFDKLGFFSYSEIDVTIILTLENVKLFDIKSISLPGVDLLTPADFIEKEAFHPSHHCANAANSNSNYCTKIKNIRKIDITKPSDIIIQAHRGIWGDGNSNENTLEAMEAAKNKGIFLLESDIMPYAVEKRNVATDTEMENFLTPTGLACFHDFRLNRCTNENSTDYIFDKSRAFLSRLIFKKPRSQEITNPQEKIFFFDDLIYYAASNDLLVCADIKNLENNGKIELTEYDNANYKKRSLMLNIKNAIETASNIQNKNYLKNLVIKTYETYTDIRHELVEVYGLDENLFNQVLWAPMIAPNDKKWQVDSKTKSYETKKIRKWLNDWMIYNEVVLYYETNFLNDFDNKTAKMTKNNFSIVKNAQEKKVSAMEYIYEMTGRRSGIFSEEPVGSKGTVNRWGKWSIKNSQNDRRGDHIWLFNQPFMKYSVITTDRPDIWEQFQNN